MTTEGSYFADYLSQALMDVLSERERRIIELRSGLIGDKPHTLAEIAQEFGVTRERIRQIVIKCYEKILSRGKRQIEHGGQDQPCAKLLLYVRGLIRPKEEGAIQRLVDFVENNRPCLQLSAQAFALVTHLAYQWYWIPPSHMEGVREFIKQRQYARNRQRRHSEKFQDLLSGVIWPREIKLLTREDLNWERAREVSIGRRGEVGAFYSGKMTKVVEYESRSELDFLLRLEQLGEVAFYQEQPFKILYKHNGKRCAYYPDILLVLKDGKGVVVEIKPKFEMALYENWAKWKGLRKFCTSNGLGFLITDGRYSIQQVQNREVNPEYASALLASLQHGPLSWPQYSAIKDRYNIKAMDFIALVLKHRLIWHRNPFTLWLVRQTR